MEEDPNYSVVQYMSDHSGYRCGYCKSSDSNYSKGMWAHRMTVGHYQDLIDRGWRRSGCYCYKPSMDKTCCPSYTIKCDALNFRLSKSQKKVLKRMHHFLSHGSTKSYSIEKDKSEAIEESGADICIGEQFKEVAPREPLKEDLSLIRPALDGLRKASTVPESPQSQPELEKGEGQNSLQEEKPPQAPPSDPKKTDSVAGPDPSRPPCKKAKLIRREKYKAKNGQESRRRANEPKSLEDYLNEPLPETPAHQLELRLVGSHPPGKEFDDTFLASHSAYQSYQMSVHKDTPEKCSAHQYKRFLCHSPLQHWKPGSGPPRGFGSYHQQYWLDGRLIAVGVIDILPSCVSSVYLYYDPEFSFLSLGTYASLREIALTRELSSHTPELRWYYMGFYIHSCPKMRYKGAYYPSYLLCPETYSWVEISKCVPKLDGSKYSRLDEDPQATDKKGKVNIKKVLCLCGGRPMHYETYKLLEDTSAAEDAKVKEYAALTGSSCCYSMLLYMK